MKQTICGFIGAIGAWIAALFGGWTAALTTLGILMLADYITGMVIAGVFHKSPKTEQGGLDSNVGFMGLAKKCMILVFVLVAHRIDLAMGTTYLRDAVCIAYIANELISLIENAAIMGVPIPKVLQNAIEILKGKESESAQLNKSGK